MSPAPPPANRRRGNRATRGRARQARSLLHVAVDLPVACAQPVERRPGDVVEGAQHAGDVDEAGALLAPLGEVALRLAFEVDDHHVVLRDEHLAEVEIAVDAGLRTRSRVRARSLDTRVERSLRGKKGCGFGANLVGQRRQRMFERGKRVRNLRLASDRPSATRLPVSSARRRRPDRRSARRKRHGARRCACQGWRRD